MSTQNTGSPAEGSFTSTPKDGQQGDTDPQGGAAEPTGATPPAPDTTPTAAPDATSFDADRAMATIKAQRESEAAAIKRAKEAEAKVAEHERAQLSEQERVAADLKTAQDERRAAQEQLQQLQTEQTFGQAAMAAGLNPRALKAALANATLTIDSDGNIKNLSEAVEALKVEHEYLFVATTPGLKAPPAAPPNVNPGAGNTPTSTDGPVLDETQAEAARRLGLTAEEYSEYA